MSLWTSFPCSAVDARSALSPGTALWVGFPLGVLGNSVAAISRKQQKLWGALGTTSFALVLRQLLALEVVLALVASILLLFSSFGFTERLHPCHQIRWDLNICHYPGPREKIMNLWLVPVLLVTFEVGKALDSEIPGEKAENEQANNRRWL